MPASAAGMGVKLRLLIIYLVFEAIARYFFA
jgi:hypothetical protein